MMHRILLIREVDAQLTNSGCCGGRLGGKDSELGDGSEFAESRSEMERMGAVYRALKRELFDEEVEIAVVDPRNTAWLVPTLLKDARKRGSTLREMAGSVKNGIAYNSIVLDGKVLFSGRVPSPEDAVAAVRAELEGAARVP